MGRGAEEVFEKYLNGNFVYEKGLILRPETALKE